MYWCQSANGGGKMEKKLQTDPENDLYNAYKETEQELNWRWLIRTEAITMAWGEIVLFDFAMNTLLI
jgi:hypothetical protein